MLLISEVIAIIILFICLVSLRRIRKRYDAPVLVQDFTDSEWCLRKVREQEYFYGGSWETGSNGRWD